ncbi:lycopene cyclase family protein [Actinacidiphila bryophytorum]|uniref:Lycopene cyclase n=1 Tax=Actinacidiphila bryophytorum TaxID=1436133 RepID=A0A9W4H1Z3_9ACTN|nr:lycopene cyclase family protein [Actinacidiphila bryophytorum]MBM9435198.1 lycopene cyclase [Actinacidiphila bryophytorum]MBN6541579.1 lycopene cyclase [Actinacidiphila bryophytorum]CAG7643687.1 Lycopene cyclase [Actinacidiphila bryophytorum]
MLDADIAIVGAGAAGLSLAHALALPPARGGPVPSLVLIEPPPGRRPPPRTWCFWEAGAGAYEPAVTASWRWLRMHDRDGRAVVRDIDPLRYKMIRSPDFETLVGARLEGAPGLRRLDGVVERVRSRAGAAEALLAGAEGRAGSVRTRWLFDSRPPARLPAARTLLLQHFHGWFVRTRRPAFEPHVADWMDFRTPQPGHGMSFGYVLPTGRHEALVEYTQFSAAALPHTSYLAALRHYTRDVLRLGAFEVLGTETGVIPMTDASFTRSPGPSVFRIGTAGGATRPATGYTFAAIQRQSRAVANAYLAGRSPLPPRPHRLRARAMDAVVLHGLDSGTIDGADFFPRLFRQVPAVRLLRFLDGDTRMHHDIGIGLRTPVLAMLRTAAAAATLPRRHFPAHLARPPGDPEPASPRTEGEM